MKLRTATLTLLINGAVPRRDQSGRTLSYGYLEEIRRRLVIRIRWVLLNDTSITRTARHR